MGLLGLQHHLRFFDCALAAPFTSLFLFAGFAAGVKVMLRTANEFHEVAERRASAAQATPGEPGVENLPGAPGAQTGPDGQPDGKQKEG